MKLNELEGIVKEKLRRSSRTIDIACLGLRVTNLLKGIDFDNPLIEEMEIIRHQQGSAIVFSIDNGRTRYRATISPTSLHVESDYDVGESMNAGINFNFGGKRVADAYRKLSEHILSNQERVKERALSFPTEAH